MTFKKIKLFFIDFKSKYKIKNYLKIFRKKITLILLICNTLSLFYFLCFIISSKFTLDFFKVFCFFFWLGLIAISLYRFYLDTKLLLNNKPFKFKLGVLALYLIPILIIYLSTPLSCCVGNSSLLSNTSFEILPSRGKIFGSSFKRMLWENRNGVWAPNSKVINPASKHLLPIINGSKRSPIIPYNIVSPMTLNKEFYLFPIFNEKTGKKIYQFIPREGFKHPPYGCNDLVRQYEIYHKYYKNSYWPNQTIGERVLWNKPMYLLDFNNVSAFNRGRTIDFFAGGGTLQNNFKFFDPWVGDEFMSAKSTKKTSGFFQLGTTPFNLPNYEEDLCLIKKHNFSIDENKMLLYKDSILQHEQAVFPYVNFKFYLMDQQGRYIVNIVEVTKTLEDILYEDIFSLKPCRLQNRTISFKLTVSDLRKLLSSGELINK
jgi:hypothetical protein